jgi:hypothetical protein
MNNYPETPSREEYQFGLQAFLGMFVVLAVFLSYLNTFAKDPKAIAAFGIGLVIAYAISGAIGVWSGRFSTVMFWAGIGAVCGTLAITQTTVFHSADVVAWPVIGGVTGAAAAAVQDGKLARRMLCTSLIGFSLVMAYTLIFLGGQQHSLLVLLNVCAIGGGALWGLVVDLACRFEKWTSIPRHFFALGLVLLAIGGHWLIVTFTRIL